MAAVTPFANDVLAEGMPSRDAPQGMTPIVYIALHDVITRQVMLENCDELYLKTKYYMCLCNRFESTS